MWEPPSPGDLRGHQWAHEPPEAIRGREGGARQKKGEPGPSQLADESLTKRNLVGEEQPPP